MRRLVLLLAAALFVASCSDDTETAEPDSTTTTTTSTTSTTSTSTTTTSTTTTSTNTTTTVAPDPCALIGEDGTPVVGVGGSVADLLARLGPAWTSTPDDAFLVDIAGHQFDCDGEIRFYAAWALGDVEVITVILSDHPDFVDPAGVGPGMLVDDAIALHGGSATVGINIEFEQREFITFADGGTPDWQYQVRGPDFSYAGVYPEPLDGYVETSTFTTGAVVERIWFG